MQVAPDAISARVSDASAARCRYVNRTWRGLSSSTSAACGSLTFTIRSDSATTAGASGTILARCAVYASSVIAEPSPAPLWTTTSCPASASSRTPAGVRATRYSSAFTSDGTPTLTAIPRSASTLHVSLPVVLVFHLHPLSGLGQHRAEDLLDLLELLGPRDQWRRELDHRVPAVVSAADQAAPIELPGQEPAQERLGLLVVERLLGVLVLDQLDRLEVARTAHIADDREVTQRIEHRPERRLVGAHVLQDPLVLERVDRRHRDRRADRMPGER